MIFKSTTRFGRPAVKVGSFYVLWNFSKRAWGFRKSNDPRQLALNFGTVMLLYELPIVALVPSVTSPEPYSEEGI